MLKLSRPEPGILKRRNTFNIEHSPFNFQHSDFETMCDHHRSRPQQCYDVTADGNFLVLSRRADDPSGTIVVIRQ